MRKVILALLLLSCSAFGQFGSGTAKRIIQGTPKPATCAVGDKWIDTTASPATEYSCLLANTWSAAGGGGAINPTTNCIPKKTGASTFGDSALCDNGSSVTSTEPMAFPSLIFTDGAAPSAPAAGQHQPFSLTNLGMGQEDSSGTLTYIGAQLIDAQAGTSITIGAGDRAKLITSSNAAAVAASIAQAGSAGFPAGFPVDIYVIGAGTVTVTPATSTINGAATLVIPSGCSAHIVSDGAQYTAAFRGCSVIDTNHSVTVTTGSGTSIGSTSFCSTTFCPVGTYLVNIYLDITTPCGTSGSYSVSLVYTDDVGSKTFVVPLQGTGVSLGAVTTTSTANFGQAAFILRSTGAASINYLTTAVACGSAGPMVGKLYLSAKQVQL